MVVKQPKFTRVEGADILMKSSSLALPINGAWESAAKTASEWMFCCILLNCGKKNRGFGLVKLRHLTCVVLHFALTFFHNPLGVSLRAI
jgi:hypothetical protein